MSEPTQSSRKEIGESLLEGAAIGWALGTVHELSRRLMDIQRVRSSLEELKLTIEAKDLTKDPNIIAAVKLVCDEGFNLAKTLGSISGMVGINTEKKTEFKSWDPEWSGPDSPGRVADKTEVIRYLIVSTGADEETFDVHEGENPKYSQQQIQALLAKIRLHSADDESEVIENVWWRILGKDEISHVNEYTELMNLIHQHVPELP